MTNYKLLLERLTSREIEVAQLDAQRMDVDTEQRELDDHLIRLQRQRAAIESKRAGLEARARRVNEETDDILRSEVVGGSALSTRQRSEPTLTASTDDNVQLDEMDMDATIVDSSNTISPMQAERSVASASGLVISAANQEDDAAAGLVALASQNSELNDIDHDTDQLQASESSQPAINPGPVVLLANSDSPEPPESQRISEEQFATIQQTYDTAILHNGVVYINACGITLASGRICGVNACEKLLNLPHMSPWLKGRWGLRQHMAMKHRALPDEVAKHAVISHRVSYEDAVRMSQGRDPVEPIMLRNCYVEMSFAEFRKRLPLVGVGDVVMSDQTPLRDENSGELVQHPLPRLEQGRSSTPEAPSYSPFSSPERPLATVVASRRPQKRSAAAMTTTTAPEMSTPVSAVTATSSSPVRRRRPPAPRPARIFAETPPQKGMRMGVPLDRHGRTFSFDTPDSGSDEDRENARPVIKHYRGS